MVSKLLVSSIALITLGCAHGAGDRTTAFASQLEGDGEVRLEGWLALRGEVMLYSNKSAMQEARRYPECISGVLEERVQDDPTSWVGKKVVITGLLYNYESLEREARQVIPRRVLDGSIVSNYCFGKKVLLIRSIRLADF